MALRFIVWDRKKIDWKTGADWMDSNAPRWTWIVNADTSSRTCTTDPAPRLRIYAFSLTSGLRRWGDAALLLVLIVLKM